MSTARRSLYERLPEIYRIRDVEQSPAGQLKEYLDILDSVPAAIRDDIEALYHDFFIETCQDWVIRYLGDLLGVSHLSGDPWTLRADVARTVFHRRRKGTLGAVESLTYTLSGWAAHAVELRDRVVWNQHLNHQRPDAGGLPPTPLEIERLGSIAGAARGGTVTLRDPALLSFANGPFDPFAHVADVKPLRAGAARYNVPNLAVFLWRLEDYTVPVTRPVLVDNEIVDRTAEAAAGEAGWLLRYEIHPLGEPMVLFNTHRFEPGAEPPVLTHEDAVPGPMPRARLTSGAPAGNPSAYVAVERYETAYPEAPGADAVGLTVHLPGAPLETIRDWRYRGANLCAWEDGLRPLPLTNEVIVDPEHGRVLIGIDGAVEKADVEALAAGLFVSATYGFSGSTRGSTGAHPVMRPDTPLEWDDRTTDVVRVNWHLDHNGLQTALAALPTTVGNPTVIEINDSMVHEVDISGLALGRSLWVRAASGQRPIIRLKRPLRFAVSTVTGPDAQVLMDTLTVKLEGVYLTWDKTSAEFAPGTALIERAALNRLVIDGCTLDPGSYRTLGGTRQLARHAMKLANDYGFSRAGDIDAFDQVPAIELNRSICGPLAIDDGYALSVSDSIIDARSGPGEADPELAVHAVTNPATDWGPAIKVNGMTCFGRMRVTGATGEGGIWVHRLEVHDNQSGCIRSSYFSGRGDRLPPHQGCVLGTQAPLSFTSEVFGEAGYGQLRLTCDARILEEGPGRDEMGAFGYLLGTHKWKNISIRYREYMPVGVRPILLPVT